MAPNKKAGGGSLMLVNDTPGEECRIAILTDGKLDGLLTERASTATQVGNIYKGKVTNVEPAMKRKSVPMNASSRGDDRPAAGDGPIPGSQSVNHAFWVHTAVRTETIGRIRSAARPRDPAKPPR